LAQENQSHYFPDIPCNFVTWGLNFLHAAYGRNSWANVILVPMRLA
jgi:hypothetical protein